MVCERLCGQVLTGETWRIPCLRKKLVCLCVCVHKSMDVFMVEYLNVCLNLSVRFSLCFYICIYVCVCAFLYF